eukprot:6038473-Amphidinium_carterae.2
MEEDWCSDSGRRGRHEAVKSKYNSDSPCPRVRVDQALWCARKLDLANRKTSQVCVKMMHKVELTGFVSTLCCASAQQQRIFVLSSATSKDPMQN